MFIVCHSSRTCQTKGLIITAKSIKAPPKQNTHCNLSSLLKRPNY